MATPAPCKVTNHVNLKDYDNDIKPEVNAA